MKSLTSKINERELREYDEAGAITGATIARTSEGYVLVIQASWKKGDHVVYNQRGKPRAWASLDRLLKYLGEVVPSVRAYELVLVAPLQLAEGAPAGEAPDATSSPATARTAASTRVEQQSNSPTTGARRKSSTKPVAS